MRIRTPPPPSPPEDADNIPAVVDERTSLLAESDSEPRDGEKSIWKRPSIWWLLPFIVLFTLGFGAVAVPRINLNMSLVCRDYLAEKARRDPNFTYPPIDYGGDNEQCRTSEIQSLVARFQLYLNVIEGLLASWISPMLGNLSDRYGRTRFIALTALATLLNEAIIAMVVSAPETMPIGLLFVGSTLDGLGGSFTTAMALVQSYACDCTPFKTRGSAFSLFQGALFVGVAIGPTLAALLIKKTGKTVLVFYIAIAFHSIFVLAVGFLVPESLSKARQKAAREKHELKSLSHDRATGSLWKTLNPLKLFVPLRDIWPAVGRPSRIFPHPNGATAPLRRNIFLLAMLDASVFSIAMGAVQVIVIYVAFVFHWGSVETSLFASVTNIVRVVALFVILPLITRLFRARHPVAEKKIPGSNMSDLIIIRLAIILDVVGYIGYALSRRPSEMVSSGVFTSLGSMASPTVQSALSKHVPQGQVGQMMGTLGLLHALGRVIGPAVLGYLYSKTVATFPQAVFVSLAGFLGIVFCASLFIRPHVSLEDDSEPSSDEPVGGEYDPLLSG